MAKTKKKTTNISRDPLCISPLRPTKRFIMISYVDHQLYIGGQADAESPPAFISAILWTVQDLQLSLLSNIAFANLPLKESTQPDFSDIEFGVEWLTQHLPAHNILVASRAGLSRAPSIIMAYLCCKHGLSFLQAQNLVTQQRPGTTAIPHLPSIIKKLQAATPAYSLISQ